MSLVERAGKYATGKKRRKTCHRWKAWKNMPPVESAGKHVTTHRWKARENMQTIESVENMEQVESAGKHVIGGMPRK